MAIEKKYGTLDIPGIPADEPIFILRAQDNLALSLLREYWRRRTDPCTFVGSPGLSTEDKRKLRDHMNAVLDAFEDWPICKNPTL